MDPTFTRIDRRIVRKPANSMARSGIQLHKERGVIYNHRRSKDANNIEYMKKMTILFENGEKTEKDSLWERTNYTVVGPVSNLEKMNGGKVYIDGTFTQAVGTEKKRDDEITKYGQILMVCTKIEEIDEETNKKSQAVVPLFMVLMKDRKQGENTFSFL